jgi:hypothetical protein
MYKMVIKALRLWEQIHTDFKLEELEKAGLVDGEQRGKSPNVDEVTLFTALKKQWKDFEKSTRLHDDAYMMRCLADLRNVAGIYVLKLEKVKMED